MQAVAIVWLRDGEAGRGKLCLGRNNSSAADSRMLSWSPLLQEPKILLLLTSACRSGSGSYLLRDNLLSPNQSSWWDEENDNPSW